MLFLSFFFLLFLSILTSSSSFQNKVSFPTSYSFIIPPLSSSTLINSNIKRSFIRSLSSSSIFSSSSFISSSSTLSPANEKLARKRSKHFEHNYITYNPLLVKTKNDLINKRYYNEVEEINLGDGKEEIENDPLFVQLLTLYEKFEQGEISNESLEKYIPKIGEEVEGEIISINETGAFIDIPGRFPGFLPNREVSLDSSETCLKKLKVGDHIKAILVGTIRGKPVVSLRRIIIESTWKTLKEAKEADLELEATITDVNSGGALCNLMGLRAFLPASHYISYSVQPSEINKKIPVKILDINKDSNKIIVSYRRAIQSCSNYTSNHSPPSTSLPFDLSTSPDSSTSDAATTIVIGSQFKRGDLLQGTITGIRDYGIFFDLHGGNVGLLHISQITNENLINKQISLSNHFKVGMKLPLIVLNNDKENGKISLNLKLLENSPGEALSNLTNLIKNSTEKYKELSKNSEAFLTKLSFYQPKKKFSKSE